jgi:hypothetical protein
MTTHNLFLVSDFLFVFGRSRAEHDAQRLSAHSVEATTLLVFIGLSFFALLITLVDSLF